MWLMLRRLPLIAILLGGAACAPTDEAASLGLKTGSNPESGPLTIVRPEAGAVFAPGERISVRAESRFAAARVLIVVGDQASLQTDGSLAASFPAPEHHGPLMVDVMAVDETGQEHSAQVEVVIQPVAPMVNLIPADRELGVIEGDRVELRFSAEYEDGSLHEVSARLLKFEPRDPSVAVVEDGHVIGLTIGRTLVRATFGGSVEAWVPVEVWSCPQVEPPDVHVSGSTALCPGSSVTLTSSDADAYSWSTGETTRSISVSEVGEYTVTATVVGNCTATSVPITVTRLDAAGPTAPCEE